MVSRCLADPGSQQGLVRKDVTFGQDQGLFSLPALHLACSNLVAYAVLLSPVLRQLFNFSFESFSLYTENQVPPVHQFFISVESCRVKSSSSELFILVINLRVYIEKFAVPWCTLIPLFVTWSHSCQLRHRGVILGFLQHKFKSFPPCRTISLCWRWEQGEAKHPGSCSASVLLSSGIAFLSQAFFNENKLVNNMEMLNLLTLMLLPANVAPFQCF